MSHSKTHVYICSAGHSGSTLLDMLLGTHPQCESLGELSLLPMDIAMGNRCGCGEHYKACQLWSPILSTYAREHGIDVWNDPYSLNLGYMAGINVDRSRINGRYKLKWLPVLALKYAQQKWKLPFIAPLVRMHDAGTWNTLELYDRVLQHTGKSVTVDSTKRYPKAAAIYQARPENTRLILLVRDGRGVFYSGIKRGFSRSYSLKSWFNYYNRSLPIFRKHVAPEHIHTVKYEELVKDPEGVLQGVCRFLGINFDERMLNFRSVVHHNVNGNKMKIGSASELRLDDAWSRELSRADCDYFLRMAGSLNKSLGYE
jgi:hypothetical protein